MNEAQGILKKLYMEGKVNALKETIIHCQRELMALGVELKTSENPGGEHRYVGEPNHKLTEQQIDDIKASPLSSYKLAESYPASSTQIRRIKSGARCSTV